MGIQTEKYIFAVPYWIVNIVERNNLPLTTVLDLEKLITITSAEDLALTSLLNEHNERIFGTGNYSPWYTNWCKDANSWNKFTSQIKPLEDIVRSDLEDRLFSPSAKEDRYDEPFEIKDIDSKTFLVIIYPGYFSGDDAKVHQNKLTKEMLKLFFIYEGYDNMTHRQLFESYLNKL